SPTERRRPGRTRFPRRAASNAPPNRPSRKPTPPPNNKWRVNLIILVVQTKRIHRDVDRESHGLFALRESPGDNALFPCAEVVPGKCSSHIVIGIEDDQPAVDLDSG